jgi:ectoine hydroxylase-related dioxygenase (phytanoyl-CoA dioxygenase family)
VAGSHRLLDGLPRLGSPQIRRRLQREQYFRDLLSARTADRERFVSEPGFVGDVALQVVELAGGPGDVWLVDMRVLHAPAPNASAAPRMMVTQRFVREEVRDAIGAASAGGAEPVAPPVGEGPDPDLH